MLWRRTFTRNLCGLQSDTQQGLVVQQTVLQSVNALVRDVVMTQIYRLQINDCPL